MGTKGAFIDLDNSAFQFTFSNQGWFLIYYELFAPSLSLGFFYSNLIRIFWSLADAYINKNIHLGSAKVDKE